MINEYQNLCRGYFSTQNSSYIAYWYLYWYVYLLLHACVIKVLQLKMFDREKGRVNIKTLELLSFWLLFMQTSCHFCMTEHAIDILPAAYTLQSTPFKNFLTLILHNRAGHIHASCHLYCMTEHAIYTDTLNVIYIKWHIHTSCHLFMSEQANNTLHVIYITILVGGKVCWVCWMSEVSN